ncbi:putative PurR-regulated permease PerM [Catenuloplanes nepalensis]|uniref:PurR-regulated permease PerM n=1 Tax=Catenuloplanes nepalensis TaxID=587533 RepID=A0ABT9N4D5_9ACTN|nr:putative PurR-regulated permease PerM [Catenuloplanes nepalensis]
MRVGRLSGIRRNLRRAYESRTPEPPAVVEARPPEDPPEIVHTSTMSRDDAEVPHALRLAAAWSWRLIVVGVIGYVLLRFFGTIRIVIIPLSIALLLSALLTPAVGWFLRLRFPRSLATALVLVAGLGAVAGTLTMVVTQFVDGLPQLSRNATVGIRQIQDWLRDGPLRLDDEQFNTALNTGQQWLDQNTQALTTGAVSTAATVFELFTGALLVLFSTFFFLRDGRKIWGFVVRLFPVNARWRLADAGEASWRTLVSYVRATVLVAFIDAVGIGFFLFVFDVPFPFPLAALVFLGAFVPIVGATVSGAVAILVALVDSGWVTALIILGVVIGVQQVEGHILQPLIMGRAVAIHPLAVIIGIAAGVVLAGITGALVAVPLIAVLNTGIRRLTAGHRPEAPPEAIALNPKNP